MPQRKGTEKYVDESAFEATVGATAVVDGQVVKYTGGLIVDAGAATAVEGLFVCTHSAAASAKVRVAPFAQIRMTAASAPTEGEFYDLTNGTTPNLSSGSGSGSPMQCIGGYEAASASALFRFNR